MGVRASRKIAAACERTLAFRAIVDGDRPDFRTISDFRKPRLAAFKPLFLDVLGLAGEMGLAKLGDLSADGTKIKANASRHKAMSYGYANKSIAELGKMGMDPHIATGRQKHTDAPMPLVTGTPPVDASA